jgi:membrane-bound lytic murein transglycosylase B
MKKILLLLLLLGSSLLVHSKTNVDGFVQHMVTTQGFDAAELSQLLAKAHKRQDIIDKISRPAERTLNWESYRKIFLTDKRAKQGVRFWKNNRKALEKAEKEYGVPAQYIVAIIGVETFYGRITGKDKVLDALYTLAFHYPKRSKFFTAELEKFLILTREEELDPATPKGSYAGAMGLGQFMPSSYLAYAVDFDGDGKRDIWNNETDAIGSVANYFARHGWKAGLPVTVVLADVPEDAQGYSKKGMKPAYTLADFRKSGIKVPADLADSLKTALIRLELDNSVEYWAGFENFYVITRYNHSEMYAMAVHQLGERIHALAGNN